MNKSCKTVRSLSTPQGWDSDIANDYASLPCFMHEVDEVYSGLVARNMHEITPDSRPQSHACETGAEGVNIDNGPASRP